MLFWCCFAQAWDGGSPVFFLQRSGWSAVGEPLQKTPGTVAENPETVAKTPPSQKQRYKEKTPLSQNILVTVAKNTSPTPPAPER